VKKLLLFLAAVVLLLIIASLLYNLFYVSRIINQKQQQQQDLQAERKKIEEAMGNVEVARRSEARPAYALGISLIQARRFKDNIFLEVNLTNNSASNQYFNKYFTIRLKDKEMMQCHFIENLSQVDFPLTEIEQKAMITDHLTFLPNETIHGYLCFRCPNPKSQAYMLLFDVKKIDFTPEDFLPGKAVDVAINDSVIYQAYQIRSHTNDEFLREQLASFIFLDVNLINKSTQEDFYSSELFMLKDKKGTPCTRLGPGSISNLREQLGNYAGNILDSKWAALPAGETVRRSICFECNKDSGKDFTLIVSPSNKEISVVATIAQKAEEVAAAGVSEKK